MTTTTVEQVQHPSTTIWDRTLANMREAKKKDPKRYEKYKQALTAAGIVLPPDLN